MESETAKDVQVRPSSTALWFGILAPPIAWAADLQIRYALVSVACDRGWHAALSLISIPLLALSIAAGFAAWRGLKIGENETAYPQRVRFMALGGVMLSAVFSLTIIAATIPDFFINACN